MDDSEEVSIKALLGSPTEKNISLLRELISKRYVPEALCFQQRNIAFGIVRCTDGSADAVAELIRKKIVDIFDFKWEDVGRSCVQDWAALAVSRFLEVETEGCEMHNGDKIAA